MITRRVRQYAIACIACLLLGLGGCAVMPPDRRTPGLGFELPTAWTATTARADDVNRAWWTTLGNDDLAATVAEALERNHDLKAAAARIRTAAAEARIAGADLYPQVSGGFSASRQRTNFTGSTIPGLGSDDVTPVRTENYGVSLDVHWELDVWGRIRSGAQAAAADVQAAQADYAAARLSIAAQTAKAWLAVTEARQQVALSERTVENFRATARKATDRVDAGVQPPNDKFLAMTNLASAQALLQQRRQVLDSTQRQLEVLLNRYPAAQVEGAESLPALPAPPPAGLPAGLVRRRPDLVVAERRYAAAAQRVDAAEASLYPRISLTASGGTASEELGDLLSAERLVWTLAGNLVQPLFEGGRLRAQVMSAQGRSDEAAEQFAQQALLAFADVETALRAEQLLIDREKALAEAVEQAHAAVRVSQNRYDQGVESFIVVLESQRRALDAEGAWLAVRREVLDNRINLHLSLGGGFEDSMPEVPESDNTTAEAGRVER